MTRPTMALGLAVAVLCGVSARAAGPQRVVSLVPATTEMVFAMGAGGRLAGVGSYDAYPPEATKLPRLGGLLNPDVERILAMKPDLVVVYSTQTELRQQLERASIPVFLYVHKGLPDITQTIRALGSRLDAAAPANALANRIDSQLAAVRARVAGRPRPRTLLVMGREVGSLRGVLASGGFGFLHDMLETAGGADVLADIPRESVTLSTEMILARAPEVIIELHYGTDLNASRLDSERAVWNRLGSVPAVKSGRIHLLVGDEFVVPGPRIVTAVDRFARTLHPDAFK